MAHIVTIDEIENSANKTVWYDFDSKIKDVDSDGNITANLELKSVGDFVQVSGNVKGILNLECDLCLKPFKFDMNFDIDELFAKHALYNDYSQETELKEGQFITDLNGSGEIDIYDLLYQSVILNLPNKKVCGINCNGREFLHEEEMLDPRMEVFKNIKIHPKNE